MDEDDVESYSRLFAHIEPATSRRLLLAALDSFAAEGFQRATTRDIAARAGLSPAGVYLHYESKMALLIEISRIGHEAVLAHVADAIREIESPPDRVRAFTEASVTWQTRFHTLGRVTNYQFEELSEEGLAIIRPLRRRFSSLLQTELRRGVDSGDFSISDVPGTSRAMLSLGIDVSRWYSPHGPTPMEDVGRLYGELALRMVRPWAD